MKSTLFNYIRHFESLYRVFLFGEYICFKIIIWNLLVFKSEIAIDYLVFGIHFDIKHNKVGEFAL